MSEKLEDIDSYADRANELYVLYVPNTASTVAAIKTSELSFANNELMQTLKTLSDQVASLSTKVDGIEARSAPEEATNYFQANAISQQAHYPQKQPAQPRFQQQGPNNFSRQLAPGNFPRRTPFNAQAGATTWNTAGHVTRPPRPQPNNWQQQPQQDYDNYRTANFSAPINAQGLCPYHQQFGSQARNCWEGCRYYTTGSSISAVNYYSGN